ncbi:MULTISPECIES: hypothetical protein [Rhodopseudomonas]|uniref:Uncharacterized protein n=1 Tax=Rhodopseudomonas palustris TaxID=1076 RepID=A0A0D7DZ65_RHOPL|nr:MULTISPECIES: hypothetical protein [Rhodopseudomonas]KIZ32682.1 hypothetical protein OO17_29575 [Rhodopseudomonas palustris]MDF3813884.1 hypothetical protein [Rhodopseudomonas sp. BAL398]WOK15474.1 hypothetical protein RBJ75_14875 [Rhodopseudomonas sp. BAL398]
MFVWVLLAIILIGGAAAIVNDAAYGGGLFDSATVVSVAALSALTLYLGRGWWHGSNRGQWLQHALIWAAIALAVAVAYRLLPMITALDL